MSGFFHQRIHHRHNKGNFDRYHNDSVIQGKEYYWIWFDKDGQHKGLWGAYQTYEQAERKAVSSLNVPYEIVKLRTRDENEASRQLKARLLGESGDVERTFNKFSHKEDK